MAEYIEREKLLENLTIECDNCDDFCSDCFLSDYLEIVKKMPTIDPESLRPVARLKQTDIFLWTENYTCTRCEEILVLEDGTKEVNEYKYCPFCGAKIEGIDREEADEE